MRWRLSIVVATAVLMPAPVAAAQAEALALVHSERVALGNSTLTASFSDWPVKAGRSLDFVFEPDGGIEGRGGTVRAISPSGQPRALGIVGLDGEPDMKLQRHPQARHAWGLDVVALSEEGLWRFEFTVHGPSGTATTALPVPVGPAPGPPAALSWTVGMMPWAVALLILGRRWWRVRERTALGWND
jgi:hypothetical protein